MDKVRNVSGGMPLRLSDLDLIQGVNKDLLKSIVAGMSGGTSCIVYGLGWTLNGGNIIFAEGFYFDGSEIFYVPAHTYTYNENYQPYLESDFSTTEQRTFKDHVDRDCWEYRRYKFGYAASVPGGKVVYNTLKTIDLLRDESALAAIITAKTMSAVASVQYASGYTSGSTYNSVQVNANSLGDIQIIGAFNATSASGKLLTIPAGYRPPASVIGHFYADDDTIGILKIKTNGEVYVVGASLTSVNYMNFSFNKLYSDLIGYTWTIGGGQQ